MHKGAMNCSCIVLVENKNDQMDGAMESTPKNFKYPRLKVSIADLG